MNTTKHTPGPWTAERCDTGMEILDMNQESVAVACHYGDPYSSIREEANAKLIAAAPELLEALEEILSAWEKLPEGHYPPAIVQNWLAQDVQPAMDTVRTAIAKATT